MLAIASHDFNWLAHMGHHMLVEEIKCQQMLSERDEAEGSVGWAGLMKEHKRELLMKTNNKQVHTSTMFKKFEGAVLAKKCSRLCQHFYLDEVLQETRYKCFIRHLRSLCHLDHKIPIRLSSLIYHNVFFKLPLGKIELHLAITVTVFSRVY